MVRLTDRPDMTLDVYRGCKTTIQYFLQDFLCLKVTDHVKGLNITVHQVWITLL